MQRNDLARSVPKRAARPIGRGLALLTLLSLATAAPAEPPPRYELRPGEWLIYEHRTRASTPDGAPAGPLRASQLQLWCMERRDDAWLLLVEQMPIIDGRAGPSRGGLLWVDERGRKRYFAESLSDPEDVEAVASIFPTLRAADADAGEWSTTPDLLDRVLRCTRAADSADGVIEVDFEVEDRREVDLAIGQRWTGRYRFDRNERLITHLALRQLDLERRPREMSELRLHERRERDAGWCTRRMEEWSRYEAVLRGQMRHLTTPLAEGETPTQRARRIETLWDELLATLRGAVDSPVRRLAAAQRGEAAGLADSIAARQHAARLWGRPFALSWSLPGFDGTPVESETLRAGRCVEFFWRASDRNCLHTFAALRAARLALPPEELQIVCINLDADTSLARRVAQICAPELQHVFAGPAPVDSGGAQPLVPAVRMIESDDRCAELLLERQPQLTDLVLSWARPARPLIRETLTP